MFCPPRLATRRVKFLCSALERGLVLTRASAASGNGGAVLDNDEALSLTNVTVTACVVAKGGGGAVAVNSAAGSLALTDCTLSGNSASGSNSDGGAVFAAAASTV